jgi:hypothetical protein
VELWLARNNRCTRKKYYLLPPCHISHNKSQMDVSGNQTGKLSHSYITNENFITIKLDCYCWVLPGWIMKTDDRRNTRIKFLSQWRRHYPKLLQIGLFVCVSCNFTYHVLCTIHLQWPMGLQCNTVLRIFDFLCANGAGEFASGTGFIRSSCLDWIYAANVMNCKRIGHLILKDSWLCAGELHRKLQTSSGSDCFINTSVISKVLHTVRFLFKNEFILQNTFTGLQCNLYCALSQRSNVWANIVFLTGRLRCWCDWFLGSPH